MLAQPPCPNDVPHGDGKSANGTVLGRAAELDGLGACLRGLLAGNEHVVLCEANASLGIEWLSPNAAEALGGSQQKGSVLSLVAPESRGVVSRAIFRAARENTTRVRVRANDGRDGDMVVAADNEYLRGLRDCDGTPVDDPRRSRAAGSSYAIGLFIFDARKPPGGGAAPWAEASWCDRRASSVAGRLISRGNCICLLDVDDRGLVVQALGGLDDVKASALVGASPLVVVSDEQRNQVRAAFSEARRSGATRVSRTHRCAAALNANATALSTCAFADGGGGCVILVYVASHRRPDASTDARMAKSPSLAAIARSLSIQDTDATSKKRKRALSMACFDAPKLQAPRGCDAKHHPQARLFDESSSWSSEASSPPRRAGFDEDDDWGHFVFPDGEPDFSLPPIGAPNRSRGGHADRDARREPSNEAQPKDDASATPRRPPPMRVVIDIDSLLPRQQSIDNYQRAIAAMAPAPALRYSALALDNLVSTVLPRPESIAAFRASMKELGRRRAASQAMSTDALDSTASSAGRGDALPEEDALPRMDDADNDAMDDADMDDDDDQSLESLLDEKDDDDVLSDLVDGTAIARHQTQRRAKPSSELASSCSSLCYPLDRTEHSFSIASAPPPQATTAAMDTSALSSAGLLASAQPAAKATALPSTTQRQHVHIVG